MNKDTIYREDAIRVASEECLELRGIFGRIEKRIKELPSADRPQGTYTDSKDNVEWYAIGATCNLCGERWMGSRNYCPNCGAYMKGADDETEMS